MTLLSPPKDLGMNVHMSRYLTCISQAARHLGDYHLGPIQKLQMQDGFFSRMNFFLYELLTFLSPSGLQTLRPLRKSSSFISRQSLIHFLSVDTFYFSKYHQLSIYNNDLKILF